MSQLAWTDQHHMIKDDFETFTMKHEPSCVHSGLAFCYINYSWFQVNFMLLLRSDLLHYKTLSLFQNLVIFHLYCNWVILIFFVWTKHKPASPYNSTVKTITTMTSNNDDDNSNSNSNSTRRNANMTKKLKKIPISKYMFTGRTVNLLFQSFFIIFTYFPSTSLHSLPVCSAWIS